MNSSLKTFGIIALFAAVVYGVTFISQFNFTASDLGDENADRLADRDPILLMQSNTMMYNPTSSQPSQRFFPGFYEISQEPQKVSFWFQNRNNDPVDVEIVDRSCTSCSMAALGTVTNQQMVACASRENVGLPGIMPGFAGVPDLTTVLASAKLLSEIKFRPFDFDKKKDIAQIPAAESEEEPTWCVLQLGVIVSGLGSKNLSAYTTFSLPEQLEPKRIAFNISVVGMSPFLVEPEDLRFGSLDMEGGGRTADVVYWSATRTPDELPPPSIALSESDRLVSVGPAELLSEPELAKLSRQLTNQGKKAPIKAAYKFTVSVLPKVSQDSAAPPPDIGPFQRSIGVSGPDSSSTRINVSGVITGLVEISGGSELNLGRFSGPAGVSKSVVLVSDLTELELETVPDEFRPGYIKGELEPQTSTDGRKRWTLKVSVPPGSGFGDLPPESAIVLKSLGEKSQRIRIPVRGQAGLR